jgi:hypothetical protein
LAPLDRRVSKQDQAQRRRQRQRHHHRRADRECVGEDQGLEEGSCEALEEEDRSHSGEDDQCRVDDRPANLERRVEDDSGGRPAGALRALLPQTANDVLDPDDRVVDDDADR